MPCNIGVILVAAGKGTRFDDELPKQFHTVLNAPVLSWAMKPFVNHPEVFQIVVVLPPEDALSPPAWLSEMVTATLSITAGGTTRTESVQAGLNALEKQCQFVLIHDGARPVLSRELVDQVIAHVRRGISVVPSLPVTDTIKRADQAGRVTNTVPREGLYRVQTPQGFPRQILQRALDGAVGILKATDDATLVETLGEAVQLIPGDDANIKVTVRADLELAEWKLSKI